MGRFGAPNWERPDRRDKNLTSCELLARLSGLNHWKPDTRAKTLTFSPILSRLSGRFKKCRISNPGSAKSALSDSLLSASRHPPQGDRHSENTTS
ncbi:hypothetical protein AKL15_12330 [Corynebacterium glutamicum]|nr:hypothetical protein AKL15_12330 [Corynebacterium glutamicum]QDX79222.1 hypothetical protein AKL16_12350 [Corynebacterium glutamicum]TWS36519.1 hypothetical protein AKJ20_04610 [Corynebacterium glutamicum]TWS36882.1 hypothetical protein AKJ19_02920 [Corynebacterium glutamicum]TWS42747.1 hypothetical protein AKJ24_06745 [Corynebacterium glutamicum]